MHLRVSLSYIKVGCFVEGDEIDSIVNGKEGNEWARKPLI